MSYLHTLLFGIYPYIALLVFILGSIIRYDREQYTWQAGSSQLLRMDGFRLANNLFHIGVIFILIGHFVGLLMPASIYHHVISAENKQLLAMVSGGIAGVMAFVGMTMLLIRRLTDPRIRATSSKSDIAILIMLYVQLILGLMTIPFSAGHMDGSVMVMLAHWAQGIVTFHGYEAAQAIAGVGIIYKLHLLLGMTIVLMFPFCRLVHIASLPLKYFGRNYQVVRQKRLNQ